MFAHSHPPIACDVLDQTSKSNSGQDVGGLLFEGCVFLTFFLFYVLWFPAFVRVASCFLLFASGFRPSACVFCLPLSACCFSFLARCFLLSFYLSCCRSPSTSPVVSAEHASGRNVSDTGSKTSVCNSRMRVLMLLLSANCASATHTQMSAKQRVGSLNSNSQVQFLHVVPHDCSACISVGVTNVDCHESFFNGSVGNTHSISPVDNGFSLSLLHLSSQAAAVAVEGYSSHVPADDEQTLEAEDEWDTCKAFFNLSVMCGFFALLF